MKSLSLVPALLAVSTAGALIAAPAPAQPIVGDFRPASIKDPEVVMAAKWAVQARAKSSHQKITLLSIQSAEKQLVAGMNYRVALRVKTGTKIGRAKATIYRDLQNKYSLSGWMPLK